MLDAILLHQCIFNSLKRMSEHCVAYALHPTPTLEGEIGKMPAFSRNFTSESIKYLHLARAYAFKYTICMGLIAAVRDIQLERHRSAVIRHQQ